MTRRAIERSGFTLVEVMLTTVLAAVLLVALWSLLSIYSKAFEGGHARTEQSQLARALLEQISTDVQSAIIAPPSVLPNAMQSTPPEPVAAVAVSVSAAPAPATVARPSTSAAPAVSSPSAKGSPGQGSSAPPIFGGSVGAATTPIPSPAHQEIATASLRPAGIYGTSSYLQLDVVQPAVVLPTTEEEDLAVIVPEAPPRADELRTIVYAFEEFTDPSNPEAIPETKLVRRELNWAQAHPAHGAEREVSRPLPAGTAATNDPLVPDEPSLESNVAQGAAPQEFTSATPTDGDGVPVMSETSVPEVLAFGLRYFDGTLWSEEWDSTSRRGLPVAIEVSLRLRSAGEPVEPEAVESQVQSGADVAKVAELKHPTRRLLIPLALANRPARPSDSLGKMQSVESREPFEAETPSGLDLP